MARGRDRVVQGAISQGRPAADRRHAVPHRPSRDADRAAAHLQRAAGGRPADRHDERSAALGHRRRRRAAHHAAVRRVDRRHGHARLRNAHGDPQGEVRGARRSLPRRRRRRDRAPRVQERARAAGRAQSADRLPDARAANRSTPAAVLGILGDLAEQRVAAPTRRRRRASFRVSSRTSRSRSRSTSSSGSRASPRRSRTGRARGIAPARSTACCNDPTPPTSVETVLREFEGARLETARSRKADSPPRPRACGARRVARSRPRRGGGAVGRARAAHLGAAAGTVGRVHPRRLRGGCEQPARRARRGRHRRRSGQPLQSAVHPRSERRRARRISSTPSATDSSTPRRRRAAAASRAFRRSSSSTS